MDVQIATVAVLDLVGDSTQICRSASMGESKLKINFVSSPGEIERLLTEQIVQLIIARIDGFNGGLESFFAKVRSGRWDIPVILLCDDVDKLKVIKALRSGVFDLLEIPFEIESLSDAVRAALVRFESRLISKLHCLNLNITQIKVMEMVLRGHPNKEIAKFMNLSEQGVKYHVGQFLKRFDAANRTDLRAKVFTLIGSIPA